MLIAMQSVTHASALPLRHFQPSDLGFIITLALGGLEKASQKQCSFAIPFLPPLWALSGVTVT